MKIQILCDLHLEFGPFQWVDVGADVVILAGDCSTGRKGVQWALKTIRDRPVIYVMGNHEYYGQAWPRLVNQLRLRVTGSNLHLLEKDRVVIGDFAFLGCTLWTDFRLAGDPAIAGFEAAKRLTDYRRIKKSPGMEMVRPADHATAHARSLAWLKAAARDCEDLRKIVITHHAPSGRSLPEDFRRDKLSAAYASDLEEDVKEIGAEIWVHGHIHSRSDYHIGDTRVVANPRGYPRQNSTGFDPEFCIEL